MSINLDVWFTPAEYKDEQEQTAVVIDVLRATTSIVMAISNGCQAVIPVAQVEEALAQREVCPDVILGGERGSLLIPGFDLGNSPREYSREVVAGRKVVITTTNGTLALRRAIKAKTVIAASFVNAGAVCRFLRQTSGGGGLLCAGTKGRFSLEDALCAGLIASRLSDVAAMSDTALAAAAMYQGAQAHLREIVESSSHARHLAAVGFAADIAFCLTHDVVDVVPILADGVLKAMPG